MPTPTDTFMGPISDEGSRVTMKWFSLDSVPDGKGPGPGGTLDSQWDVGTGKIT